MKINQITTAKPNKATAQAVIGAIGALVKVSDDELHAIINHNERAIAKGLIDYPYLTKLKLCWQTHRAGGGGCMITGR